MLDLGRAGKTIQNQRLSSYRLVGMEPESHLTSLCLSGYIHFQVDMYGAALRGVHPPPRKLGFSRAEMTRAPESKKPLTGLFAFLAPPFSPTIWPSDWFSINFLTGKKGIVFILLRRSRCGISFR